MGIVDPTPEQVAALSELTDDGPVQMINLLQFNPDGGRSGYRRYLAEAQPHLARVGGRLVAHSTTRQVVIGEDEHTWWDEILTVEYPSLAAFLQMVSSESYQAIAHLRTCALARAQLIATAPDAVEVSP